MAETMTKEQVLDLLRHSREHISKVMHVIGGWGPGFKDLGRAKAHLLVVDDFVRKEI